MHAASTGLLPQDPGATKSPMEMAEELFSQQLRPQKAQPEVQHLQKHNINDEDHWNGKSNKSHNTKSRTLDKISNHNNNTGRATKATITLQVRERRRRTITNEPVHYQTKSNQKRKNLHSFIDMHARMHIRKHVNTPIQQS